MKTTIVICLYLLATFLYATLSVYGDKEIGSTLICLEDKWLDEIGESVLLFRLLVLSIFIGISLLWPIWIIKGIVNAFKNPN